MPHPRHAEGPNSQQVRELCLALPEVAEVEAWGSPTYRVGGKMFAHYVYADLTDYSESLWCAAPPGAQETLVAADPVHLFVPPYRGKSGWIAVRLDTGATDWDQVAFIVTEGYRFIAPARLAVLLNA